MRVGRAPRPLCGSGVGAADAGHGEHDTAGPARCLVAVQRDAGGGVDEHLQRRVGALLQLVHDEPPDEALARPGGAVCPAVRAKDHGQRFQEKHQHISQKMGS